LGNSLQDRLSAVNYLVALLATTQDYVCLCEITEQIQMAIESCDQKDFQGLLLKLIENDGLMSALRVILEMPAPITG
jgi:hypothetical protein